MSVGLIVLLVVVVVILLVAAGIGIVQWLKVMDEIDVMIRGE